MPESTISPGMFIKDYTTLEKGADPFQYDAFRAAIANIASETKDIGKVVDPTFIGEAVARKFGKYRPERWARTHAPGDLRPWEIGAVDKKGQPYKKPEMLQIQAALESYRNRAAVTQEEAGKAATALSLQGATTEASMRRLHELQTEAYGRREQAGETWGAAAEKAEEYVQSADLRTRQALDRLDKINTEISEGRDFAKAHAMNAAVQGVIGSMSEQEDQVIQRFGLDSKEYQQFQAKKAQTLSTTQSQIETSYQQLAEQQSLTYMNASNELQWKEDMYSSFQEQQHVETLRFLAQANDAYDMQLSQFQLTIEQMRSTGMENMANWIVQTPVFSMDIMPLATFGANLFYTRRMERQAAELMEEAGEGGGGFLGF